MLTDWNNEIIMEHLYELYLKRNIRRSVEWRQVFQNWMQQKSHIIELYIVFYTWPGNSLFTYKYVIRNPGN